MTLVFFYSVAIYTDQLGAYFSFMAFSAYHKMYGSFVSPDIVGVRAHTGVRDHIRDQRWWSTGVLM